MITRHHVDQFNAFGFLHLRGLLDPDEVGYVSSQFDASVADDVAPSVQAERTRELRDWLLTHTDIYDIPVKLFGDDFLFEGFSCQLYREDSPWHADSAIVRWTFRHIKIAIYLDSLTEHTGCLRVIPGSHREWLRLTDPRWAQAPDYMFGIKNRDMRWQSPPWGLAQLDVPYMPLETEPGDVLVFPEDLLHCAFGTGAPRRQMAIALMENPTTDEEIFNLKQRQAYAGGPNYRPSKSLMEHSDPRLRRMAARLVELGLPPADG